MRFINIFHIALILIISLACANPKRKVRRNKKKDISTREQASGKAKGEEIINNTEVIGVFSNSDAPSSTSTEEKAYNFEDKCKIIDNNTKILSNQNKIRAKFSKVFPKYRELGKGFNLELKCTNPECEANGQYVWVKKGYSNSRHKTKMFNLCEEVTKSHKCPSCNKPCNTVRAFSIYNCICKIETNEVETKKRIKQYFCVEEDDEFEYFFIKNDLLDKYSYFNIWIYQCPVLK